MALRPLVAQNNFARSLVFSEGKNWSVIDQYNAKSTENKISAVAAFDIDGKDGEDDEFIRGRESLVSE